MPNDPKAGAEAETPAVTEPVVAPTADAAAQLDVNDAKDWKRAVVIVGNHRLSQSDKRPAIVTEERRVSGERDTPSFKVEVKTSGYPAGHELYYRTDPSVEFPKDAPVVTLGVDVAQGLFWGFSPDPRWVHVGPASPAYAAANLAWQRGATDIEIIGLTDPEKEALRPWIDKLSKGGPAPVPGATDVRSPADVKITLS